MKTLDLPGVFSGSLYALLFGYALNIFIFALAILSGTGARAEHMLGAMGNSGVGLNSAAQNQLNQSQGQSQNQGINNGSGSKYNITPPQMPDHSKTKEAANRSIKDGEEVRKNQQQAVQKGLEAMTKSVGDFTNMVAGFNKNSGDDASSKELLKTIGNLGKSSGDDEALNSTMDLIIKGYKENTAAQVKAAADTGAILANIKPPEVQRRLTSLDLVESRTPSTSGQNAMADAMAASSGKSDLIPKFGNNPIGYNGGARTSFNSRDPRNANAEPTSTSQDSTASNSPTGAQPQAHAAQ